MSIDGLMRTSISGMAAQSGRLSTVAGNIANASTVGYKAASEEFTSLLLDSPSSTYLSGGVESMTRYAITQQGVLESTKSQYDLGINGAGFLLVQDPSGRIVLTRAGSFVPDNNGTLVNSAGLKLLGYPLAASGAGGGVANGTAGLLPISISGNHFAASATTLGNLATNLPSSADAVTATDLPSANSSTSVSSARTSMVIYGSLGQEVTLDLHYAATSTPGEWEVTVFNSSDRSPAGGFPYASGPLAQGTLKFDGAGQLDSTSVQSLDVPVPGGASMQLNFAGTTQLATGFSVVAVNSNGNPATATGAMEIGSDGTISETFANGGTRAIFRIPLATVASPDRLVPKSGTVFEPSSASGDLRVGTAGSAGLGSLQSGALESSTVDLASELTDMIAAQRDYTANSKVFQTGAELMDVLVNLKR